jgi:gas vesicle protein
MTSGKVVLGALAGIAIGASLGILFAPDKGSDTRRKISRKGTGYANELGDKFNEFIDTMTGKFETMMEDASTLVENGKAKAEKASSEVTAAAHSKTR